MLHDKENKYAAWIISNVSSGIERSILLRECLASLHDGLTCASCLGILVSDDKNWAYIIVFLDEVAVLFCPKYIPLDLLFDERRYSFLGAALTVVANIGMEVKKSNECF